MSVACYLRISSRSQKVDSQKNEVMKWLEANNISLDSVEWYSDVESGTTMDRPEFKRLQQDIFDGKIKSIVLWKLDRLSRRLHEGVQALAEWCERGLRVVVVTQRLDFSGALGRTLAALLLGLAEIEWEHFRDRRAAGIEIAKKKGLYCGRKKGTTKGKPARAVSLRKKGLTVPEIANSLGVSERTVFRYLGQSTA